MKSIETHYSDSTGRIEKKRGSWQHLSTRTTKIIYFGDQNQYCRETMEWTYIDRDKLCICPVKYAHKQCMNELTYLFKMKNSKLS